MNGKVVGGIAVVALLVYLLIPPSTPVRPSPEQVATPTHSLDPGPPLVSVPQPRAPAKKTFAGHACSGDCSGHEAGYSWAEEHDIDDEEDCDAAGEHSNSPSFAEGCKDYVNGDSNDSDDEKDDEEADPDGAHTIFLVIPGFLSHTSGSLS